MTRSKTFFVIMALCFLGVGGPDTSSYPRHPPSARSQFYATCRAKACLAVDMYRGAPDKLALQLGLRGKDLQYQVVPIQISSERRVYGLVFVSPRGKRALLSAYSKDPRRYRHHVRYFLPVLPNKIPLGEVIVAVKPSVLFYKVLEMRRTARVWCGRGGDAYIRTASYTSSATLVLRSCQRPLVDARLLAAFLKRKHGALMSFAEPNSLMNIQVRSGRRRLKR